MSKPKILPLPKFPTLAEIEFLERRYERNKVIYILLFVAILFFFMISLNTGKTDTGTKELLGVFLDQIGFESPWPITNSQVYIIKELRFPRALLALIIGSTLAIGGVAIQGLFRNPLAAPDILGVNSGAALGATLVIVLGNQLLPSSWSDYRLYLIPLGAFLFALGTTSLIVRVGTINGRTNILLLLLTGIALEAIIESMMGLLIYISDEQQLRSLTFWRMGDLGTAGWNEILFIVPLLILTNVMIVRHSNALNLFLLGEAAAQHLGIHVEKVKKKLILWTALSIALAVSFTGSIGFIGLAAPHLMRLMTGPNHQSLFFGSALMGGFILCLADILSRSLVTAEIPIGIITAFIGAPIFLWLLFQQRRGISYD